MKLFKMTLDMPYRYGEDSIQLSEADAKEARKALGQAGISFDDSISETARSFIATGDQVAIVGSILKDQSYGKVKIGEIVAIGEFGGDVQSQWLGILARIEKAAKELEATADLKSDFHGDLYNAHANVHMAGNAMSSYNELMLCENSCTDAVQEHLSEGWRIVAVCPQASRRPDYILGRYNMTFGAPKSALRG